MPEAVANIVHVTLKDGRTLTKRVDYPLGNAKNPVWTIELEGKFLHLVVPALGRDHSAKILDQAWSLDEQSGVHHLMKRCECRMNERSSSGAQSRDPVGNLQGDVDGVSLRPE